MNVFPCNLNGWVIAIVAYCLVAIAAFLPTLNAILRKIQLHPGGDSFNESLYFSDEGKKILTQHYSRIRGTLLFWKNQAEKFKNFHYYCLLWTIPISILIPIITQLIDEDYFSKLFLTIISSHAALLIGFHQGLRIEANYRAFRNGESDFYDLYRRMLDEPKSFGNTETIQIDTYIQDVAIVRKLVRNAETNNFPTLEDVKLTHRDK
ncbi:hypothetical protein SAMN05421820_101870 [Pedobacter steynii]|uniref:SMODS and SLOG-associating 2TM effector domain-containing protein n=1 Tax=Pedobacter steynii TaxID=430522 RepID=A0A1G9LFR3_9SPHI|nr:hypothetical protein [Pedobacter steynii]NQX38831.1 hypothetical protein [Pedobacter steynii]SDL60617.1 hypothetical protein SAMN05421820_101870 [Pedobacter steynii]